VTHVIRAASAADTERIIAIAGAAYAKYIPRLDGRKPGPLLADYPAAIAEGHTVVIARGGEIDGYMVGWPEAGAYLIEILGVDPACQGQGLGRQLIEHAAGEARRHGLAALRLYTNVVMTENVPLYRHLGFVETHRAFEEGFHRIYMRREL
jgi:ribosomal protein S18 acetylase RimI-like enzyme